MRLRIPRLDPYLVVMAKRPSRTAPGTSADGTPPNYWDYVRVEELLSLQTGLAADEAELVNDEVLSITVHQVFELWF